MKKIITLLSVTILISSLFLIKRYNGYHTLLKDTKEKLILKEFQDKRQDLTKFFQQVYELSRIISLLPSVRSIHSSNLKKAELDIVKEGLFSQEGKNTIQQIYNNLYTIGISEIYGIVKDFKPDQGETPFFMLDSLLINEGNVTEESNTLEEKKNDDIPEEEEEEYNEHLKQLNYFQVNSLHFRFHLYRRSPLYLVPQFELVITANSILKPKAKSSTSKESCIRFPFTIKPINLMALFPTSFG